MKWINLTKNRRSTHEMIFIVQIDFEVIFIESQKNNNILENKSFANKSQLTEYN